jgi:hypothetical protein
VKTFSGRMVKC